MKIKILTLYPEVYTSFLNCSIIKKSILKGIVSVELIDIKQYTLNKYSRCDSKVIGGGAGLIMKAQPIIDALRANSSGNERKIILSPRGKTYCQSKAIELSKLDELIILCGHFEGIDERVYSYFDESISIGDYILTGGETASFVLIDSIIRLIDGVISEDSIKEESFSDGLLEYAQYTEPYDFEGKTVPDILYSGNHTAIKKYRKKSSLKITKENRPDLFDKYELTKNDKKLVDEIEENKTPDWELKAIEKGKKFTKSH